MQHFMPGSRPQRRALAAIAAAIAALSSATGALAAPQLRLDGPPGSVTVGQTFNVILSGLAFDRTTLNEIIDNVTGGQNLAFSFSNATLQVLSVSIDPRWTFTAANKPGVIDQAAGTVTGTAFGAFPATTDDGFNIATFSVKALAPGNASFTLLSGQVIGQVAARAGQLIAVEYGSANIAVSAVPEVQSWALLMAGLCVVGLSRSRRP